MVNPRKPKMDQRGQAVMEYILLVSIVVMGFMMVSRMMVKMKVGEMLMKPVSETYARAYCHGHPKAKGYDDGGPELHPRAIGGGNFRLFLNPGI